MMIMKIISHASYTRSSMKTPDCHKTVTPFLSSIKDDMLLWFCFSAPSAFNFDVTRTLVFFKSGCCK